MAAESTPEEEVRRLERHYSVNPEGLVFARLADAYRRCGELERSLELLRDGLERHPDYTTGHLIEGRTLREADRPEEAAESFRRVLQLDAGNLVALRSLAELAAERGDMTEAHRWTDRLEQADPFTSFNPAEVAARAREAGESTEGEGAGDGQRPEPEGAREPGARETVGGEEPGGSPDGSEPPTPGPGDADADVPTELPGEDGLASEIAAVADEQWWSSADEEPTGDDEGADSDVATETMARLYAQQGLYEEAADVYRRLVERRPDDERFRDRLDEMTQRARGQGRGEEIREEETREEATRKEPDQRGGTGASPTAEKRPETAPSGANGADRADPDPDAPDRVSAREHFRALLRGEAAAAGGSDAEASPRDGAATGSPGRRRGAAGGAEQ